MAALGEQPELVLRLELAEANRAVEGILKPHDGLVQEDRERVDERLVHPRVMEVEQLPELALQDRDAAEVLLRLPANWSHEPAPHQQVEEAGDEEDDGQDDDYEDEAGADPVPDVDDKS